MPRSGAPKDCVNCGDSFPGPGTLCPDCTPLAARAPAQPCCPYCRSEVTWELLGRLIRRIDGGVVVLGEIADLPLVERAARKLVA